MLHTTAKNLNHILICDCAVRYGKHHLQQHSIVKVIIFSLICIFPLHFIHKRLQWSVFKYFMWCAIYPGLSFSCSPQSLTNPKWITPPKLVYVYIDGRFITAKEMRSERVKGGLLMELFDHFTEIVALKWWWWTCQVEAWHEIRFN